APAADVQVDAVVERHRGVPDVPDRQDLLASLEAAEVDPVRDDRLGDLVAVVEDGHAGVPDEVLPGAGAVPRGEGPAEGHRGADRLGGPVAALVGQDRELAETAVAVALPLRPFDALRLELD